jgi:hypothetical protein
MRSLEVILISTPLVAALLWWLGVRVFSWRAVALAALLLAGIGVALIWLGADRAFTGGYAPARLDGTRIVPGSGK